MIQMRPDDGKLVPVPPRRFSRAIVLLATFACILLFAWSMRPDGSGNDSGAVVRVSLSSVPEERVVHFGHEFPVPAPAAPDAAIADAGADVAGEDEIAPVRIAAASTAKFAGSPQSQRDQRRANYARPDANGVLPIGYSLTEGVSSVNGGVGVPKTIAAEGGEATGLTIFLIGGSLIEVDRGELVTALARLGAADKAGNLPPAGESGRLSLDRVRTAGLDLRYDAIHDRLVLRP